MSVRKVTVDKLFFECPSCRELNDIPFVDIRVRADSNGRYSMMLPNCACGSHSEIVPGKDHDTPGNNVRRIAWKRAVSAGNFYDEESRCNAEVHTKAFDAFYAVKGREEMKAVYDDSKSTVEIRSEKKE